MKYILEPIVKIDSYEVKNEKVYDLEIETDSSFCVEGNIVVHNSACTTRFITGCGVPQFSCCIDNSHVAHGLKNGDKKLGLICSDGGCINSGDVCKAFCTGADFIMLGGFWAGVDSCEGQWNDDDTFTYYGMSTHKSQEDNAEGKKNYRASEGTEITVANKGSIDSLVQELLGGIRSCCTYIGSDSIRSMNKCACFCKVNKIHNNSYKNIKNGV